MNAAKDRRAMNVDAAKVDTWEAAARSLARHLCTSLNDAQLAHLLWLYEQMVDAKLRLYQLKVASALRGVLAEDADRIERIRALIEADKATWEEERCPTR